MTKLYDLKWMASVDQAVGQMDGHNKPDFDKSILFSKLDELNIHHPTSIKDFRQNKCQKCSGSGAWINHRNTGKREGNCFNCNGTGSTRFRTTDYAYSVAVQLKSSFPNAKILTIILLSLAFEENLTWECDIKDNFTNSFCDEIYQAILIAKCPNRKTIDADGRFITVKIDPKNLHILKPQQEAI